MIWLFFGEKEKKGEGKKKKKGEISFFKKESKKLKQQTKIWRILFCVNRTNLLSLEEDPRVSISKKEGVEEKKRKQETKKKKALPFGAITPKQCLFFSG